MQRKILVSIDSKQFMNSSLELPGKQFELVKQKGIYQFEYGNDSQKFHEEKKKLI